MNTCTIYLLIVCAQVTLRKTYINIVNTLCNNVNSDLTFQYKYSKMAMQINDIESDLDYIIILQTEHGNTSDITINYSSDASGIGTIIYDHNLHNDCDQVNTPPTYAPHCRPWICGQTPPK